MKPGLSIRRGARSGMLAAAALLVAAGARASDAGGPVAPNPGQGVVAGSLVLDFQGSSPELQRAVFTGTTMTLWIRRADDPDAREIRFETTPDAWGTPGMARVTETDRRLLFVRALDAGTYEIIARSAVMSDRRADFRGGDQKPRFTVAPGVVSYIGAEVLKAHNIKGFLGSSTSTADIAIDDDVGDDGRQLYHAHPELRALPIRDTLNGQLLPAPGEDGDVASHAVDGELSLRDVAAVKASSGIAPGVFAALEAFRPATPPAAAGTLRRVVQHRAVTIDGKPAGGNTRTLEFLPDAPGYMHDTMPTGTGALEMLDYLPFVVVQSHLTKHVEKKLGFDSDTTSVTRLSGVRLPAFATALAPGANWSFETESDTSVHAKNLIKSIDRSNFVIVKRQCVTTERQPASALSPQLTGTMLTVACHQADQMEDELTMAYLEDYGAFVMLRQSVSVAPKGTRVVSEYTVSRVEVDAPPAPVVAAPVPAGVPTASTPSYDDAKAAFDRHDDATAFAGFSALANAGDARAQTMLSSMYYTGRGTPADRAQAILWVRKAAEQGDARGQFMLATAYWVGTAVPKDDRAAFGWYLKAAQQGHAEAQQMVGGFYGQGGPVAQDLQASLEWTRKSAAQGFAQGEANLAIILANGNGTPRDPVQAATWARKSADQGNAAGQSQLCKLLARGDGVPRDNEQAYFWCVLSAAQAYDEAITNKAAIERVLTAEQRARVQARVSAWRPAS